MNNRMPLQPGTDIPDASFEETKRFKDDLHTVPDSGVWVLNHHAETSIEKSVRRTLHRTYLAVALFAVACVFILFVAGLVIYRQATYVDPVKPDYSALNADSDTYWTDRTLLDIETARQSAGTNELRLQRIRTFAHQTVNEAMAISSPYSRAQTVTNIVTLLAQHDIDISLDRQLQQLGSTPLIASMRARTLVSLALSYLRQRRLPAAHTTMRQYNQLVVDADLQLNSPINEESFFGAVTVLWFLNDRDGLKELFSRQTAATTVLGFDQQMKAYRLIAGEQVRTGMTFEALDTAKHISDHVELARAWALILQYSARPPKLLPVEPTMLELLDAPQADSQAYSTFAEQIADEIFFYLAENKDIDTQASLLHRLTGILVKRDTELLNIVRHRLIESEALDDRVKQSVLKLLDNSESSVHLTDFVMNDWATSGETVRVEIMNVDSTPLRTRTDLQWVQALLAIAQGYQSIKRFHDADRVLKQAFVAAQRLTNSSIHIRSLLQIGEQQVAIGSIDAAKHTFAVIAPGLSQNQQGELARLQINARLFDDAWVTLSGIESPVNREEIGTVLLREQIRLNRFTDAERTLSLISQGRVGAEARSRLNIAREHASREDFNAVGLPSPESNDREQYCIGLIQQGFLRLADRETDRITDVQKRTDIRTRIAREYLSHYPAFNDANDPNRSIRQEIRQFIVSVAERTGQSVIQAAILTELLAYLTGQLRTEEDRTVGRYLWSQTVDVCGKIAEPSERATLLAQLIVAKNMLDNPDFSQRTLPLFTRDTHPSIVEETNRLIEQCLELVNLIENESQQVNAYVHLAKALAQIGRTTSAPMLLEHILDIATNVLDGDESVSILLSIVPTLQAMHSVDVIPVVYRLAIDEIARQFTNKSLQVDEFEWRMRDSNIERIVRSQMENGFVDDAVASADRLNEPLLRDRLLRAAVYFYLDNDNIERAESIAQRLTASAIQNSVFQNIQTIKRRTTNRPFPQNTAEQSVNR